MAIQQKINDSTRSATPRPKPGRPPKPKQPELVTPTQIPNGSISGKRSRGRPPKGNNHKPELTVSKEKVYTGKPRGRPKKGPISMDIQQRIGESTRSINIVEEYKEGLEEDGREEEEEEEMLEVVKEMAKKVNEYRSTLPHHLKSTLSSLLDSQRPSLSPSSDVSLPGPSSRLLSGAVETCSDTSTGELATDDDGERTAFDVRLLRDKIASNISAMPKVLERMNECISKIDRLVSSSETIHPLFKRKKS